MSLPQFQNILPKKSTSPVAQSSHGGPSNLLRSSTNGSTGSSELDSPTSAHKRVSTACSACKTRKSKCDGKQPCERCQRHKTECVIDEDEDLRRRRAVKRKLDDLEADRRLLTLLVTNLRNSTDKSVAPLLDMIRRHASFDELREYLRPEHSPASESADCGRTGKLDEKTHSHPNGISDEPPPPRRRALEIENLLNSSEDTHMSNNRPHR